MPSYQKQRNAEPNHSFLYFSFLDTLIPSDTLNHRVSSPFVMSLVRYFQEIYVANSANCNPITTINDDDNTTTNHNHNNNNIGLLPCARQYLNHFHALSHVILIIVYRHTHILLLLIFLPCGFIGLDRCDLW